jgi:chromosome segregation ATPase
VKLTIGVRLELAPSLVSLVREVLTSSLESHEALETALSKILDELTRLRAEVAEVRDIVESDEDADDAEIAALTAQRDELQRQIDEGEPPAGAAELIAQINADLEAIRAKVGPDTGPPVS